MSVSLKAIKILRTRSILIFIVIFIVALTTSNVTFVILYGLHTVLSSVLGGISTGYVIMQVGSRSVYTSMVPEVLANDLNRVEGVRAYAYTLTPSTINGSPIVIRGVDDIGNYEENIVSGYIPGSGNYIIMGEKAVERLGLKIGDVVFIGSLTSPNIIPLILVGIYRFGDLRDYEAVVPIKIGFIIAGRQDGIASMIQVNGASKEEIESLIRNTYNLTINYHSLDGKIIILNSLSRQVNSFNVKGDGSKSFTLHFGYYIIKYQRRYVTANLTGILLDRNTSINLKPNVKDIYMLKVCTAFNQKPIIKLENESIVYGVWINNTWIFKILAGIYTLRIGNLDYKIPVYRDTVFKPFMKSQSLENIEIDVYWSDGSPVKDYLLTIWGEEGRIITSFISSKPSNNIMLATGKYKVTVSKPPYKVEEDINIPEQNHTTLTIKAIPSSWNVPIKFFKRVKVLKSVNISNLTLESLIGITISTFTGLILTLSLLSIIAVIAVYNAFYNSCKENMNILKDLGAGRKEIFKLIGSTMFLITIISIFISYFLTIILYDKFLFNLKITIIGYGIQFSPSYASVYSMILGLTSWLYSTMKISR